jgi:predicted nucleic acid-binding protein
LTVVVDASVAVKWFFAEAGYGTARALLESDETLVAPSLILAEIGNAIWKKHRRGEVSNVDAIDVVRLAVRRFSALAPIERLMPRAIDLALAHDHPVYDCLYLALAEVEGAPVATADGRVAALAGRAGIATRSVG